MCDRQCVTSATLPARRARPLAVDLFAGAGGMSLGFEQAGFDVVAAVEYDPVHAATHGYNFPGCEILCRDASKLSARDVLLAAERGFRRMYPDEVWPGRLDALIGGPPCQGFSSGGKRDAADERNDLLLQFVRLVEDLRPRTICLENVSGLLEKKYEAVREEAFRRLRQAGYDLSGTSKALNSADFGVPQTRRRVIVLGALEGGAPGVPTSGAGVVSVRQAFEGLPSPSKYAGLLASDFVALSREDIDRRSATDGQYARRLAGLVNVPSDMSMPRVWDPGFLTGSRRTVHTADTLARFGATKRGTVEPKSRLFRLPLDGPARTLRAGSGSERGSHTSPRPIHPVEDRVITVREAARLHGYPDWFRFHTTNWHGHRQVGNSVPPPLACAAGLELIKHLSCFPDKWALPVSLGDEDLLTLSRTRAKSVLEVVDDQLPAQRTRRAPRKPLKLIEKKPV